MGFMGLKLHLNFAYILIGSINYNLFVCFLFILFFVSFYINYVSLGILMDLTPPVNSCCFYFFISISHTEFFELLQLFAPCSKRYC